MIASSGQELLFDHEHLSEIVSGILEILVGGRKIETLRQKMIKNVDVLISSVIPTLMAFSKDEEIVEDDTQNFIMFNRDLCEDRNSNTLKTQTAKLLVSLSLISDEEPFQFVLKILQFNITAIKGVENLDS